MTHDELLKEIGERATYLGNEDSVYNALRAVVELHKPLSDKMQFCMECKGQYNNEPDVIAWPCRTIQAIEKSWRES